MKTLTINENTESGLPCFLNQEGYRVISGKILRKKLEHRYIVEKHLGRKLDPKEKLHVFAVYVRYFKGLRKDESDYYRFETYICKDVTVNEFFDYRDMNIINTFGFMIKFKKEFNKKEISILDDFNGV